MKRALTLFCPLLLLGLLLQVPQWWDQDAGAIARGDAGSRSATNRSHSEMSSSHGASGSAPRSVRCAPFWWFQQGDLSVAAANFGPVYQNPEGRLVRRWTLVVHLPGTGESLTLVPGIIDAHTTTPIFAKGESFHVELAPADGFTWGELAFADDLTCEVAGLY